MSETNIKQLFDTNDNWIGHIILESDRNLIGEVCKASDYDITKVDMVITLNGIEIRHEQFEGIVNGFVERLMKQREGETKEMQDYVHWLSHKEELDAHIKEKAKELAKDILYGMINKIDWNDSELFGDN